MLLIFNSFPFVTTSLRLVVCFVLQIALDFTCLLVFQTVPGQELLKPILPRLPSLREGVDDVFSTSCGANLL